MKKRLIIIEGTDGSGKQTQTELLYTYLNNRGLDVKKISFPDYKSDSSALVKMYLKGEFGEEAESVPPKIASTFYALDRYASYTTTWSNDYNNGTVIISDRYVGSNLIHQGAKLEGLEQSSFFSWLDGFEHEVLELPRETITIFLNVPIEYTQRLMKNRNNKITNEESKDIHEKDKEHLYKAYKTACKVANLNGWIKVDCVREDKLRSIEDIHNEIVDIVKGVI